MTVKIPIRTVFDGATAIGLSEFQTGEFIGVATGGIGTTSLTANSILLGNGTNAVQSSSIQISGTVLSASDSSIITIDEGLNISGALSVTGNTTITGNLTVNGTTTTVNSTTIDITNSFTFEGATANDFETTLGVIDPTADRAINLPDVSGTIITTGNISDITGLSNSQLSNPSFTIVDDTSTTSTISLGESLLLAGGTGITSVISGDSITFNIDNTVATLTDTQTLTNKTLTTPVISSISNTGTLTLPTSTDTLIGRATTDTLTNKTLTSPKINEDVVVTATATELNFTDGVTSNIQTQMDAKASRSFAIAQAVALG
jgi:hypothetical protein